MIVFRSAVLVINGPIAVRKHAAALFHREKFILLQVCLTGSHLVFKFLRGKSLEIAALVTLLARLPVNYHQLSSTITRRLTRALSKPRRRRQRERHQTKGLMSRTMATHVRYKSLYISLPSPTKQQREMIKFCVLYRTRATTANFCISIWNYKPPLHI